MAMLASKAPYPAGLGSSTTTASTNLTANVSQPSSSYPSTRWTPTMTNPTPQHTYGSPTESEFSDVDGPDAVKNWDEDQVCEYLRRVKCGDYESLFRKNHIKGENLLEIEKDVLQEMGIDKVGDRVRLFISIKKLRTKAYANQKKRNRDSIAAFDSIQYTPSTGSPRLPNSASRAATTTTTTTSNKRYSRQYDSTSVSLEPSAPKASPLPSSPKPTTNFRAARQRAAGQAQLAQPPSTTTARFPMSLQASQARLAASSHMRNNSSMDGSLMATLPHNQEVIRVICTGGITKVVRISDCKTCEEVMRVTLRKFALREDHERNYCFWILDGVEPVTSHCRRLSDTELWRIVKDQTRPERNRLILRRVPNGEPGQAELERAAGIAKQEAEHTRATGTMADQRSQRKAQRILGESWDAMRSPTKSTSYEDRQRNLYHTARTLERPAGDDEGRSTPGRKGILRQFGGLRPPSELITSDLTSYFPDHSREDIDRTARMSMRRSARLSKVNSRLSVASSISFASSIQDVPPIPTIADSWFTSSSQLTKIRPLDIRRGSANNGNNRRDSVVSSVLDTLQEEDSCLEPSRKSYVSFADSSSEGGHVSVTDPDGNVISSSNYLDDGSSSSSLTDSGEGSVGHVAQALSEDGEDPDYELQSFLAGDSWDDSKWMKGALIGQGSFGSVYLALHAITGELLAVKQVEVPSGANTPADSRKKSMIEAMKREIGLLRELRHPNIVQYLGCGTTSDYLNIFLEYVTGGSVQTMLNSYGALPEPLVRSFVRQILNGLSYLHNRDIIHRDIKGANILVDNKGTIKISDFGISKKLETTTILNGAGNSKHRPSMQGSVFWMAPEVVKQTSYTRKADIWSLGCLVVEMMTGTHPFPDCSQLQAIFKIGGSKAAPTIPEHASNEAKKFLSQTFEIDHNNRPSADELMMSPFLIPCTYVETGKGIGGTMVGGGL